MRFKQLAISACTIVLFTAGCSDDDGHHPTHTDAAVSCALEDRDDEYVAGLQKVGENGVKVAILQSTPAPPAKDDNTWRIQVLDATDAPLAGLTVTATPLMPDHGHGTPINAEVTELATPGEYEVTPVNLWMPGLWEVTIEITDGADVSDAVTFAFCIEG